jgi:WD repeat-containing protein 23
MRASGILSCKFSGNGKELVGGNKAGEIACFDLVANRVSSRVLNAHNDEINSVCFANR